MMLVIITKCEGRLVVEWPRRILGLLEHLPSLTDWVILRTLLFHQDKNTGLVCGEDLVEGSGSALNLIEFIARISTQRL